MYYLFPVWVPPTPSSSSISPMTRKPKRKKPITIILNLSSPIINYTSIAINMTKYIISSSMINTTQKINQNKILIFLSISFLSMILCISFSYCIFLYIKHYLNIKIDIKQDKLELNRLSIVSSQDSNDIQFYTSKTNDNRSFNDIYKINQERRLSNDSVKLFRY